MVCLMKTLIQVNIVNNCPSNYVSVFRILYVELTFTISQNGGPNVPHRTHTLNIIYEVPPLPPGE